MPGAKRARSKSPVRKSRRKVSRSPKRSKVSRSPKRSKTAKAGSYHRKKKSFDGYDRYDRDESNSMDAVKRKKRSSAKITVGKQVKRARNAYSWYYSDVFHEERRKHPDLQVKELAGVIGKKWNNLSSSNKSVYQDLAAKDKRRAERERASLKKRNGYDGRPVSEYIKWSSKKRSEVKAKHPDWTFGEISKELGRQWKNMGGSSKSSRSRSKGFDGNGYDREDFDREEEMGYVGFEEEDSD